MFPVSKAVVGRVPQHSSVSTMVTTQGILMHSSRCFSFFVSHPVGSSNRIKSVGRQQGTTIAKQGMMIAKYAFGDGARRDSSDVEITEQTNWMSETSETSYPAERFMGDIRCITELLVRNQQESRQSSDRALVLLAEENQRNREALALEHQRNREAATEESKRTQGFLMQMVMHMGHNNMYPQSSSSSSPWGPPMQQSFHPSIQTMPPLMSSSPPAQQLFSSSTTFPPSQMFPSSSSSSSSLSFPESSDPLSTDVEDDGYGLVLREDTVVEMPPEVSDPTMKPMSAQPHQTRNGSNSMVQPPLLTAMPGYTPIDNTSAPQQQSLALMPPPPSSGKPDPHALTRFTTPSAATARATTSSVPTSKLLAFSKCVKNMSIPGITIHVDGSLKKYVLKGFTNVTEIRTTKDRRLCPKSYEALKLAVQTFHFLPGIPGFTIPLALMCNSVPPYGVKYVMYDNNLFRAEKSRISGQESQGFADWIVRTTAVAKSSKNKEDDDE